MKTRRKPARATKAVDIHAHFFPQSYLDVVGAEGKRFGAEYSVTAAGFTMKSPLGVNAAPVGITDLKTRIAGMDKQGVAVQALSLTAPMAYWADADVNARLARAWNDGASAAHRQYPDRLVGLITLPMLDTGRALDELQRAAALPGMRGVYLGTNVAGRDLDDPLFAPVFARIEALGLPVFLHPIQTVGGARTKPFYLGNLLGNPYDTGIAACHLVFGGVMDRHPKLQINLPHAGGTFPFLIGRIDRGWKMRPETRHLPDAPSRYLRRFTYDTIGHSKKVLQYLVAEVGADRVMLGSDYCYDMGYERPVRIVEELGLKPRDRAMIIGGTAARMLKL